MTTDRPYRKGMEPADAIAIIREAAGTQFDPHIVAVFTNLFADCRRSDYQHDLAALKGAVMMSDTSLTNEEAAGEKRMEVS
jgi:HD-GYP domain-containing protein (c-di-GMP phosphodiesterase class II)